MNPKNILLVEDNPADLKMTLYALSCVEIANHIQIARDGVEALEYLKTSSTQSRIWDCIGCCRT